MSMKAELLNSALPACELGEGPHWDAKTGHLYWVDIMGQKIHRYHLESGAQTSSPTPATVGFAVLNRANKFITGLGDTICKQDFETGATSELAKPDMHADNRFNDGKVDPRGRLWAGTMHREKANDLATGSLYRFDSRGLVKFETNIHIANGMGWSPDHKTMYFTDTVRKVIWQYDFDMESGTPMNKRVFREFSGPGRPDGLAIDTQGRILSAQWPGWGVEIFTAGGKPDGRIELPVPQVSSCAFGGPDMKTLFITTAYEGMSKDHLKEAPLSGQVFAVRMDIPGMPVAKFDE